MRLHKKGTLLCAFDRVCQSPQVISTNEDLTVYLILIGGNSAKYLCHTFGNTALRANCWNWWTNPNLNLLPLRAWGSRAEDQTTDSLRIWISGPKRSWEKSWYLFPSPSHARGKYKPFCVFDNEVQWVRRGVLLSSSPRLAAVKTWHGPLGVCLAEALWWLPGGACCRAMDAGQATGGCLLATLPADW